MSLVMIIDNDEITLSRMKQAFEKIGYQTVTTTDSLLATHLFCLYRPKIVVLDLFMRDKDGFEVTREIRSICKQSLIVATSFKERYLRMIKPLGATEVFPKHICVDLLAQSVHELRHSHSFS